MRAALAVLAALVGLGSVGAAEPSDWATLYDPAELERTRERTVPGVRSNFEQVIWPALTPDERAGLEGVRLAFPDVGDSPLAFSSGPPGLTVYLPLTSLRFYADLCLAVAWLNRDGKSPQPAYDYLALLRYRRAAHFPHARYPAPLAALAIPDAVRDDSSLDQVFYHCYASTVVFIVGHELAHLLYRDPGYGSGAARAQAQANESRADAFALERMRRLGAPPIGTPVFFTALAHLEAGRYDFADEAAWQAHLAQATHPLTARRLRAVAATLAAQAPQYARTDEDPAGAQALISGVAMQIEGLAAALEDPDIQAGIRHTALSTDPLAFAARQTAATALPGADFHGRYAGDWRDAAGVALPVTMTLARDGEAVTGRYHFGMGDGLISAGTVRDGVLYFDWRWGEAYGRGVLRADATGALDGTWGYNADREGAGTWRLTPSR